MMTRGQRREWRLVWLLLAAAIALTALVYWPSLHGPYVFDDYPNILENRDVHLHSLDWESLRKAALSSPSPVLIRPLSMLSFGIDWYIGGGNPFEMRLVNLMIHLLNGLLLFALLRRIARRATQLHPHDDSPAAADVLALCVCAAWLLAPINFTAVGYIVQRMESLCQLFVLAGLYGYLRGRERMIAGKHGLVLAAASLVLGTALGTLAKESALLLPLYAFILEWALFDFRRRGSQRDGRLYALYAVLLVVPACVAAYWVIEHALAASAWIARPFTLAERLLTEPRILLYYVRWSLLPTADSLALYHDQIAVSKSLFDPPSTLWSILALAAAAGAAIRLRRSHPLAALGIGWFLGAHLLTGTVIPLELVFEHRNYFASIGLYLLLFSLLLPNAGARMPFARATTCFAFLALFASVTWIRAQDWSNPVAFALSEAQKNPDSPRTAYELARTYVILSQYKADSPFVRPAYDALEHCAAMPTSNALPDQGLLLLSARLHQAAPAGTWRRFREKIARQPLSSENVSALYSLSRCTIDGECVFPPEEMVQSFLAALSHEPPNTYVLAVYASYAINVMHDASLAVDLARDGVQRDPRSLQARRNLILLLQATGQHDNATQLYRRTLDELPEAARDGAFRAWADDLLKDPQAPIQPVPVPESTS